jgi:hypothetical protein
MPFNTSDLAGILEAGLVKTYNSCALDVQHIKMIRTQTNAFLFITIKLAQTLPNKS